MGMTAAALPLIWVAVGGRSDLTSTLIGTLTVLLVFQALTIYGSQYALVFMGVLLVLTVLIAPNGLVLGIMNLISRLAARRSKKDA
jgi:branched-chain amino acid transport system permease protein